MNINWTIVGQSLTFFVFVWFCWKFIWPPIVNAMRERQEAIADGLASAERAAKDLELAQERATDQLKEAKDEAAGLIVGQVVDIREDPDDPKLRRQVFIRPKRSLKHLTRVVVLVPEQ